MCYNFRNIVAFLDVEKKQMDKSTYSIILLFFSLIWEVSAQPPNNLCINAIEINNVENFCSAESAYTLQDATFNADFSPTCQFTENPDVWFTFIARATVLNTRVNGDAGIIQGGTLIHPELTIYDGNCSMLVQLGCLSDAFGNGVVEVITNDLMIGRRYYIRVSSRDAQQGTFQLCINNFFKVPDPSGDCITGVVLCDKASFSVPLLIGSGNDQNEVMGTCIQAEFASAWYKWTCDRPGTLTFTLFPNNPSDDIDFAVYELPDGLNDCNDKRVVRCMASGENGGEPLENWIRCYGPTGLKEESTDIQENPGCAPGDDNFLSPLSMEAGKSYALVVNNFSNTGSGFTIEFGGTGTFLGPVADFTIADPDQFCRMDSILILDQSTTPGGGSIEQYNWSFGTGSTPGSSTTSGPHNVFYGDPGFKTITLTIENERGCQVSTSQSILVECCDYPVVVDAGSDGTVDLGNDILLGVFVDLPGINYTFEWSPPGLLDCFTCPGPIAMPVNDTQFQVTVTDEQGCIGIDSVWVRVTKNKPVYIPNAFSPDGNGINDRFTVYTNRAALNVKVLRIYDRWGSLMHESFDFPPNDPAFGWDGTRNGLKLQQGVYAYYVEIEFLDEEIDFYAGDITLYE